MTALEALENLKNLSQDVQYASKIPSIDNELEVIETTLKALEIIKPYCLVTDYETDDPDTRYELAFFKKIYITQEEYDLLKEVLLWVWNTYLQDALEKASL